MVRKKKEPEINIKVKNFDKVEKGCNNSKTPHCGHCWIFGSALAMILSYERGASILYAILHGALSWFYILFRAMQLWGWF